MTIITPIEDLHDIANIKRQEFERRCMHQTFSSYLGNNVLICRILSKLKIYVDSRDTGIAPHLIMDGFWEAWITQLMAKIIQPGFTCLDIGANVGYYSLLMSELCLAGEMGITIALEPNPTMCHLLKLSESIHTRHFKVIEKAISNYIGEATLTIPNSLFGSATLQSQGLSQNNFQINVTTTTIDGIVEELNLTKVDMVKIDVEGEEPAVFEGMKKTLSENKDMHIIMEYTPNRYHGKKTSFTDYLMENFNIHLIKDNAQVEKINDDKLKKLMEIEEHTDLYLIQK